MYTYTKWKIIEELIIRIIKIFIFILLREKLKTTVTSITIYSLL